MPIRFPLARLLGAAALVALLASPAALAQTVSGVVTGEGGAPLPGVNVVLDGTYVGQATDADGRFGLDVSFDRGARTLVFSFTGYQTRRVEVPGPTSSLAVSLEPDVLSGGDVVVSASRVEESILEAPVTVERVSMAQLQQRPSTEVIASLDRLKGVDVSRSSMLISSLSTRGFNSAKSERLIQLVDGFDFVDPTLSLYVGNLGGLPEIDLAGVEIVYGANSALYGANAFNGVVLFQSRDPFQDQGLSVTARGGERGMMEAQGRWAQRVGDRFAYKVVGSYFEADDFISANYSTLTTIPGNFDGGALRSATDPRGADLVNRYGEVAVVTPNTCLVPAAGGCGLTIGALGLEGNVYTPGFSEGDLVLGDYRAMAARVAGELSVLLADDVKASIVGAYADGNGIYQSSNRYAFDGVGSRRVGATLEGTDWAIRAFANDSEPGNTYDLGFLGSFMNRAPYQDPDTGEMIMVPNGAGGTRPLIYAERYGQVYAATFAGARQQGASVADAYAAAAAATSGIYPTLGDPRFDAARDLTLANETPGSSPTFKSDGQIYNLDGQYRFDLGGIGASVGANVRQYALNSQGTLYSDGPNSPLVCSGGTCTRETRDDISNYDFGGYLQLRASLLDDALDLSAVGRVDAFENFDARFSPRASAVYSFGPADRHNLRASVSRAFRQPAQLDQFISLDVGSLLLLGNIGDGYEGLAFTPTAATGPVGGPITIDPLTVEQMDSFEVGYKGLLGDLFADLSYYRSLYTDFIGTRRFFGRETGDTPNPAELAAPPAPSDPAYANRTRLLQVWTNADQEVTTQGFLASLEYRVDRAFIPTVNYTWSDIEEVDDLILGFNTPEHKVNVGASGQIGPALGYGVNYRWVDTYDYAMPFAEGTIESHGVLDVQASYDVPTFGVTLLAGGTNLTDADNLSAYGAAPMGRILYAGLRYNP
ncbi:TonB-dependent receptor [Rubrivirga marina]|uniref:Uncharacterized protein n=1 Tax=Rubrivirga marina TaxID=1196024 RepID=A0A271IW89_9BACT|nr:TonB-dependent receptor [Rubrivirga marina]PAP74985.1 hypothetical protein BSZ37_00235 [Rubrivirga marina]